MTRTADTSGGPVNTSVRLEDVLRLALEDFERSVVEVRRDDLAVLLKIAVRARAAGLIGDDAVVPLDAMQRVAEVLNGW